MEKLLVLGAPIFQIEVIKKAKQMGCYVGIVDINPNAPAFPYADETFVGSITDYNVVLNIATRFMPDGILVGTCDTAVLTGSRVCETLGLAGHGVETAVNSTDKVRMLEAFEQAGVSHPKYQVIKKDSIINPDINIEFPLISKPVDSAGGRGVKIIHNQEELRKALLYSSLASGSGDVLVEEYMIGPEVSVEIIVADGVPYIVQITDKITSGEPYFYEIGHSQPSCLDNSTKDKIINLAISAVLAVGIKNSPAHVEIIVTEDGPKMVELGARLGSDCITSYLTEISVNGINMIESAIKLALGKKLDIGRIDDSGFASAIRFIPASKGVIKSVDGIDVVKQLPNVVNVTSTGILGKYYDSATDDSARFGFVVCKGKTPHDALMNCDNAIEKIHFNIS